MLNPEAQSDYIFRKPVKEVIKVKLGLKGEALIQKDWCPFKKTPENSLSSSTKEKLCEDTVIRQPSAN